MKKDTIKTYKISIKNNDLMQLVVFHGSLLLTKLVFFAMLDLTFPL